MNDQLETAVNLAWTAGNSNTRFGIAAKYQIDSDASFSVSVVPVWNSHFPFTMNSYAFFKTGMSQAMHALHGNSGCLHYELRCTTTSCDDAPLRFRSQSLLHVLSS